MQRMTGMLIGAVFGMVFVLINAADPLNAVIGGVLRGLAVLSLIGVVVMWFLAVRRVKTGRTEPIAIPGPAAPMFSRGYWLVVVAEAVLLFGGIAVLRAWGRPEQTNVAWIAFVVGVHFIVLAPVWKQWGIAVPGVILTVLGVIGLVLAATSAVAWVPFVSGVLSGVFLLLGCVTFAWRGLASLTPRDEVTAAA
ncbi:hypothetical protein GCM10023194_68760 [Planotetraspora phitsanulokensis]|uniref:Uncharacterized protein n=1 Tax=Planotetraspora phitsanulokensis TaxID=575192 RepID=A0A8J3XH16_9ACTN|nr:hypothetical protein [Planotetraspora phitsanulokensis]GII39561.1 hypothetical protein Pph01_45640 [Planotetraspora phitsanulokensis]